MNSAGFVSYKRVPDCEPKEPARPELQTSLLPATGTELLSSIVASYTCKPNVSLCLPDRPPPTGIALSESIKPIAEGKSHLAGDGHHGHPARPHH
ncbi:hypothetical protein GDO81_021621 [Engystomops pustulosus]|uniref:Uncharacterized protein n=1 Tax=Engystomops pustulosus TaxID=76066 RepID=A0AAV6ZEI2_ENGPU|nr:hypothetical protein GDO81_021621 [Engystomops pustulosus]